MKQRALSGIQPSGAIHLGNYFGMLKQAVELADSGQYDCFYFLANYHAMTTVRDGERLRALTAGAALDILSVGLSPEKAVIFRQSDVPEVCELTWVFNCLINKSLMELAHSYKDKVNKGIDASMGLFDYPVLMASDILIYKSHIVPIGRDQKQHLEMTRDIAGLFNRAYGDCFPLPEPRFTETAKVPGTTWDVDETGQRTFSKMSKSYDNHIELFGDPKAIKKKIMGIETDSTPLESPKDPEKDIIFTLYSLMATDAEISDLAARYRAGGMGYGDAKKLLLRKVESIFGPYRDRRAELAARPDDVNDILKSGAAKARAVARQTMDDVRSRAGIS